MMRRALALAGSTLIWLFLIMAADPRLAAASHWIGTRKSWEFPWYTVAMMMVIPYVILGCLGVLIYRTLRSR